MLNNLQTEERRHDPALASITITPPFLDRDEPSATGCRAQQDRAEASGTKPHCLWCGWAFTPRTSGGSAQRFCCSSHRQAFWIAARRWTMRAIDAGLLSVDCLKASPTSVHADRTPFRSETNAAP
jgi:hypothetical protein